MKRTGKILTDNKCVKNKRSHCDPFVKHQCYGILLVLLFFTSCVSPVSVPVNVLKPSGISRLFCIDSVAVVNNCGRWDSFTFNDTLVYPAISDKLVEALAQKLANDENFKCVVRIDSCLDDSSSMHVHLLTDSVRSQIFTDWGVSSIVSIDLAYAKIPLVSRTGRGDVMSNACFSVYDDRDSVRTYSVVSDFYYPETTIKEEMLDEDLVDVLSDAVRNRLSSYWTTVGRVIYTSLASDLRYGYLAYTSGNYDEARKMWLETAAGSSIRKYRVAAFVNLALLDEMEDQYNDALINLNKAEEAMGTKRYAGISDFIESYRKILQERQQVSEKMK